jgi:repressor LexA
VKALTAKQQRVLDFLKSKILENGYPPTVREICDATGLSSTSTVHSHLATLTKKGFIKRDSAKNRAIEILDEDFYAGGRAVIHVPVVGRFTPGKPVLTEENIEDTFPLPRDYVKKTDCYLLHVKGDHLAADGILDGDMVLAHLQGEAKDGDNVIILNEKGAQVIKFNRKLKSANVVGKVIGLYRRY